MLDHLQESGSPSEQTSGLGSCQTLKDGVVVVCPTQREQQEIVEALRQALLDLEPNLKSRLDDQFLLKFLRARKFRHQRALELVKNYYKQRIKYPDFYKKMSCSYYPHVFSHTGTGKLDAKDPLGRPVFVAKDFQIWDPKAIPVLDLLACILMGLEVALEDPEAQETGLVFLADAEGFSLRHLRALDPYVVAQIISVTWNSFPGKFKLVHILNAPYYFQLFFAMITPFLPRKLRGRFIFHGKDLTSLHSYLPRDILPMEFGGELGAFDNTEWHRTIHQHDPVFQRDQRYGYVTEN